MELERIEFTLEDILAVHQGWITKLYTQDRKTEAQIVELLSLQNLIVDLSQVQKCIRDWNLEPLPSFTTTPLLEELLSRSNRTTSHSRRNQSSQFRTSPNQNTTRQPAIRNSIQPLTSVQPSPSAPRVPASEVPSGRETYSARPLPPLPSALEVHAPSRDCRAPVSLLRTSTRCRHGYDPDDCTEFSDGLYGLPSGPSSLKRYTETEEFHELIAVGLFGTCGGGPCGVIGSPPKTTVQDAGENVASEQKEEEEDEDDEASSDEILLVKYVRAQDKATVGNREDKEKTVRLRYGKDKNRSKDWVREKQKKYEDEVREKKKDYKEEDRKRKRLETSSGGSIDTEKKKEKET